MDSASVVAGSHSPLMRWAMTEGSVSYTLANDCMTNWADTPTLNPPVSSLLKTNFCDLSMTDQVFRMKVPFSSSVIPAMLCSIDMKSLKSPVGLPSFWDGSSKASVSARSPT